MVKYHKYQTPLGTVLYRVEITDIKEAERLAKMEGYKEGDSLWDYLDPISNEAQLHKIFKDITKAKKYALTHRQEDVYAAPRIDQIELQEEIIDGESFRHWEVTEHYVVDVDEVVETE